MYGNVSGRIKNIMLNNKDICANIILAFLIKGGALAVSLCTIPAYMDYFDNQSALGVWFTVLSIFNLILNFDLGIGNGLRNKLAESIARKDVITGKKYISTAYFLFGIICIAAVVLGVIFIPLVDWGKFFKVDKNIIHSNILLYSMLIVFIGIIFQFFLKIVSSILYAMQKSAVNDLLVFFANLLLLLFAKTVNSGNIDSKFLKLSIAHAVLINIPYMAVTIWVMTKGLKEYFPLKFTIEKKVISEIIGMGFLFLILQLNIAMIGGTNEIIITRLFTSNDVVNYQIYNKGFNFIRTLVNMSFVPIWSASSREISRGNIEWVKKMHKLVLALSIIMFFVLLLLLPLYQVFVNIWLGNNTVKIIPAYLFIFSIYTFLFILNGANCTIANGISCLKPQIPFTTVAAILNIPLAVGLSYFFQSWIAIVVANIVSFLIVCIPQPIYIKKYLENL